MWAAKNELEAKNKRLQGLMDAALVVVGELRAWILVPPLADLKDTEL